MKQFKVVSLYFFLIVNLFSGLGVNAKSIVAADIVEGQQYVPNFLKQKGHFEKNANGVSAYADAAGTRPVNGSGGAPTLSCTRTTSSPIDGDGSLLITKDAASRQGEGCTIQFTIDSAYKAKVLQIEFDYLVASGTFTAGSSSADSDLIAYIYDVTNSTLIEPSSIKLLSNSTTIADHFVANFQTSATGTTYNLILHQATTSSSAYSVRADNFQVKPSQYVYGTPITDWQEYSLTIGASTTAPTLGTTTTNKAMWRRVGDSMEITYSLVQTGAGSAGSGYYKFPIPSGYTVDSNKALVGTNNASSVGNGRAYNGATVVIGNMEIIDSTNLILTALNESTAVNQIGSAFYQLSGASIQYGFNAKVPITGWSSSVQVSDGFDSRLISTKVARATAQALTDGNELKVQFNTVLDDKTASYDNVTNYRFTAPTSGDFEFDGYLSMQGTAGTGSAYVALYKNGSGVSYSHTGKTGSGTATWGMPFRFKAENVKAGDYFEIYAQQNTGGSVNVLGSDSVGQGSVLNIKKLQAPTTISETEVVAASYNSSSTSISSSLATIVYTSKDVDTHNAYNTSTGLFTCPVAGLYEVTAGIFAASTFTSQQASTIVVRKNSTDLYEAVQRHAASESSQVYQINSPPINCLAGDTLSIRFSLEGTSPSISASATRNFVGFKRIK